MVDWLKTNSPELMDKEVSSSFAGIKKTLLHMWDTERFWLSVVKQASPPQTVDENKIESVYSGLVKESEDFSNYVNSLDDASLCENCDLDTPWVKGALPKFEFIQHVINHSTYHRGQITSMSHQLGLNKAPMTDYNFYNMIVKPAL